LPAWLRADLNLAPVTFSCLGPFTFLFNFLVPVQFVCWKAFPLPSLRLLFLGEFFSCFRTPHLDTSPFPFLLVSSSPLRDCHSCFPLATRILFSPLAPPSFFHIAGMFFWFRWASFKPLFHGLGLLSQVSLARHSLLAQPVYRVGVTP